MNYKITEFFLPLVQTSLLHVPMSGMVERILNWGAAAYKWAPEMITCRGSGDITIWKLSFRYFSLEIGGGGRGGWGRLKSLQSPSSTVPEYGIKFLTSSTTTAVKSRPTSWVHHLFFYFLPKVGRMLKKVACMAGIESKGREIKGELLRSFWTFSIPFYGLPCRLWKRMWMSLFDYSYNGR